MVHFLSRRLISKNGQFKFITEAAAGLIWRRSLILCWRIYLCMDSISFCVRGRRLEQQEPLSILRPVVSVLVHIPSYLLNRIHNRHGIYLMKSGTSFSSCPVTAPSWMVSVCGSWVTVCSGTPPMTSCGDGKLLLLAWASTS